MKKCAFLAVGRTFAGCIFAFLALGCVEQSTENADSYKRRPQESEPVPKEPPVASYNLVDAVREGFVELEIQGGGLDKIWINLKSKDERTLQIKVPPGLIFTAVRTNTQNMVTRVEEAVIVEPLQEKYRFSVRVACANMGKATPKAEDRFRITEQLEDGSDMLKLISAPGFAETEFRVQQFAVWTVESNPKEFVGIGTGSSGSGPSIAEMEEIRALLVEAGISLKRDHKFRGPVGPPIQMGLEQALRDGHVEMNVTGLRESSISVSLQSKSDDPLEVTIPVGYRFRCETAPVSDMVVKTERAFKLTHYLHRKQWQIDSVSESMQKPPPEGDHVLISSPKKVEDEQVLRLLSVPRDFLPTTASRDRYRRICQLAYWIFLHNPDLANCTQACALASSQYWSAPPKTEEIAQIRQLFQKLEFNPEDFKILNSGDWLTSMRVWTDHEGKTLEAELISVRKDTNGKLIGELKLKETGQQVPYPIERLSPEDIKFVHKRIETLGIF